MCVLGGVLDSMIRTFIACDIPNTIRKKIASFQSTLREYRADIKWVRPESIHITLKFLGDVEESKIQAVVQAVGQAAKSKVPFTTSIEGTGTFPNDRSPRILWIGIQEGADRLADLASRMEEAFFLLGFPKEKRSYSAHLTLGRVRSLHRIQDTIRALHSTPFEAGSFRVDEIVVMKSDLQSTGAVYTPLHRIKLEG